eukprot:scaffold82549_cov35-Tisochrysis_lutea.AAC.4
MLAVTPSRSMSAHLLCQDERSQENGSPRGDQERDTGCRREPARVGRDTLSGGKTPTHAGGWAK